MLSIKHFILSLIFLIIISTTSSNLYADVCGNNVQSGTTLELLSSNVSLGSGLGASGFNSFDSDNDGYPEVLFGIGSGFGGNKSFAILEYDAIKNDYSLICQSPSYEEDISKIIGFKNDTILTGSLIATGSTIEIIDHIQGIKTQVIEANLSSNNNGFSNFTIKDLALDDIDNDGSLEIAVLTDNQIVIFDANTFNYEQSISYGGNSFSIGNFISNKNQIALNTGYLIEVNDAESSVVWDYSILGFSNTFLKAGDIDNDGLDEIIAADQWYNLRVFNADTRGLLWEYTTDQDISTLNIYDVTDDAIPEVIYGDRQGSSIYALNDTGSLLWKTGNQFDSGVTDVLVTDLDQDSSLELIWGAGYYSSGPDYLYVYDIDTAEIEWTSPETNGPYYGVAFGDLNGDNIPDRIYISFESQASFGDGIVTAINGATDEVLWKTSSNTFEGFAWSGLQDVTIADIDGDNINEVLVATDRLYEGRVYILNSADGSVNSKIEFENQTIYSVKVADIDGDGSNEIIAGGEQNIYLVDGTTLATISTLPNLGNNGGLIRSFELMNIDDDESLEIIALRERIFIIDPDNNSLIPSSTLHTSIAISKDIFSDENIIYLGDAEGMLSILKPDGSTEKITQLCNASVDSLETFNPVTLLFTCEGRLATYDIVGSKVTWQSTNKLDDKLGFYDRIAIATVSGVKQILLGGSRVHLFQEKDTGISGSPTAENASFEVQFNQSLVATLDASDPSSASLSYGIFRQPTHGSIEITNAELGEFTFTPSDTFTGNADFEFYVSNGTSVSNLATISINRIPFSYDIDDDGTVTPLTDGLLVLRYLFSFTGDALIAGAVGSNAKRSTSTEIETYLQTAVSSNYLDIDSNGNVEPLTDGLLFLRYLFDFRGDSLIQNAIGDNATRITSEAIENHLSTN